METRRVGFKNPRGHELAARLDLPKHHHPKAYALFAHCFTCTKEFKATVNISRALAHAGIAVLRFDFTGLGESGGEFPDTNFTTNVEDILAAAHFLETEYAAPQLLVGHSFGGLAMIKAARRIPASVAVVTLATPSAPRHVLTHFGAGRARIENEGIAEVQVLDHRVLIKRQFVDDVSLAQIDSELSTLGRALLVLHSPVDQVVNIEHAQRLFDGAAQPKSFIALEGADHLLSDRHDGVYTGNLIALWASKYLRPAVVADSTEARRLGTVAGGLAASQ